MRKIFTITTLLMLFSSLHSMDSNEIDFHVTIEQNGKLIEPVKGLVTLDKSEFSIVFEFSDPMGLLINGSFKKRTFKLASKGKPKSKLPGFQNTGMAEGLLNPDKEIFLSDNSPNYWFYDDKKENRFNSVEELNGKIQCKRIIQNLFEVDINKIIKIVNIEKPLYLVFISYKRGQSISDEIELKREWIIIRWNK